LLTCEVTDSTEISFFGDTLVNITYRRSYGLTSELPSHIWRTRLRPWVQQLFGTPDSLISRDSSMPETGRLTGTPELLSC
jgi:hypothetical protein